MICLRTFSNALLTAAFLLFSGTHAICQSNYEKGWESLNDADVFEAMSHFRKAVDDPATREDALIALSMLYSRTNQEEEASKLFNKFFDESDDPFPVLYAIWFDDGVVGDDFKKEPHQLQLLEKLEKLPANKGKLDAAAQYRLGLHYSGSMDNKNANSHYNSIQSINDWMFLGPFDNVMNSGYDKDFGVVAHPEPEATFSSKYGAEIKWFDPPQSSNDGYQSSRMHFVNSSSICYAQTFVEAPGDMQVLLKFGYSGSLKVWLNDSLIYREQEPRKTDLDYFRYKCSLNKGFNRILVQLGDFEESQPSFSIRITDLNHNPLALPNKNGKMHYEKKLAVAEPIPHFAAQALEAKAKADDNNLLYKILLIKSYLRANELDKAEDVLKAVQVMAPDNYFVLRNSVIFYQYADDGTNQNKYYELFKERYPEDINILENEISENIEKKDKEKVRELIKTYLSKYGDRYNELYYDIQLATMNEDNQRVLTLIDKIFKEFPEKYYPLVTRYNIEKSYYSNPAKANKMLESYLKKKFSNNIFLELFENYVNEGRFGDAEKLIYKKLELFPYSIDELRKIINLYSRQNRYQDAIKVCDGILENRPSDYSTLNDKALLHKFLNNETEALKNYEEALRYFPFSFETNEKIRELKGMKKAIDLVEKPDPVAVIKEYETNFTPSVKKPYDIVLENKSLIIFKSKATGIIHHYIIKMNDESAIEHWQSINMSPSTNMTIYIDEVKTIKKNGNKIEAERTNSNVVFTNLEVGDYIFVSYQEKQVYGGKSSVYISDRYSLNSYVPAYKTNYNVFVEEGLDINFTILNDEQQPETSKNHGFNTYVWSKTSPDVLQDEPFAIPFNDIAKRVHVSLDFSWKDIVQWYSDLSTYQASADYTIKKIISELFDGEQFSEEQKSKMIYEFVNKNIQYSFLDFRQSNFIPQKASEVYHSRLGDCKDVSTLFVSLARAAGLKANLVLINTSDNGQKDVILPSLHFNHCIVKVYLDSGPVILELTDPNLPYGHLFYYHQGAAILEIPTVLSSTDDVRLEYLQPNPDYHSEVIRSSVVEVTEDLKIKVDQKVVKTGSRAATTCQHYYNEDDKTRKDNLKKSLSSQFNSALTVQQLDFIDLQPRKDSAVMTYTYLVENDILKLGSFRSMKIPFSDILIQMKVFQDEERTYPFNYVYYENADKYEESIEIVLTENFSLTELPENVNLEYKNYTYSLNFRQIDDKKLEVHRLFKPDRENIAPEDFSGFQNFMAKVNEAENTHLLFK